MKIFAKEPGFTLVEVMVALVIFLVASMGLLPLLLNSMHTNLGNTLHSKGRQLAAQVMAEMQVVEYSRLGLLPESPLLAEDIEIRQQVQPDSPRSGQSLLTVSARWQHKGTTHDYTLQTIRSAP